jgi:hypothetical protein
MRQEQEQQRQQFEASRSEMKGDMEAASARHAADRARLDQQVLDATRNLAEARLESARQAEQQRIDRDLFESRVRDYEVNQAALAGQLETARQEAEDLGISSLDDLERSDSTRFDRIVELCRVAESAPLPSGMFHVGFFGVSGVGKSSLINRSLGIEDAAAGAAKVGFAQTTFEISPYPMPLTSRTFWDFPGSTDRISYVTALYVGMLKAMNFIGIVVNRTPDQIAKLVTLLERLSIPYHVIVNKFEEVPRDQRDAVKAQIQRELDALNPRCCRGIYFVSAKFPNAVGLDWEALVRVIA